MLNEVKMLPVHKLLDKIIDLLKDWFCKRCQLVVGTTTKLTKYAKNELLFKQDNSCTYEVLSLNLHEFIGKCSKFEAYVDMLDKTCS